MYNTEKISTSNKGVIVTTSQEGADAFGSHNVLATYVDDENDFSTGSLSGRTVVLVPEGANESTALTKALGKVMLEASEWMWISVIGEAGQTAAEWLAENGIEEFRAISRQTARGVVGGQQKHKVADVVDIHSGNVVTTAVVEDGHTVLECRRNKDGSLVAGALANRSWLLHHHDDYRGRLKYDTFLCSIMLDGKKITDRDFAVAANWMSNRGLTISSGKASVDPAVIVSQLPENIYDSLQDYITGLEWDGQERIRKWAIDHMGSPNNAYTQAVSSKFLIGAVQRAMDPGCAMDAVLILEGKQGVGKSSAVATLFRKRAWFLDSLRKLDDKDSSMLIAGKWGVELSELSSLFRTNVQAAKAWISQRDEEFRSPFGKVVESWPRRCVFVGTTNELDGYLSDPTGGRRFWPLPVSKIDIEGLEAVADQLWAEAYHEYKQGKTWKLVGPEIEWARDQQADRAVSDTWDEKIESYLEDQKVRRSLAEVLEFGLEVEDSRRNQMRAGRSLVRMGYTKMRPKMEGSDGKTHRVFMWYSPRW